MKFQLQYPHLLMLNFQTNLLSYLKELFYTTLTSQIIRAYRICLF